ncbi:hypothetical protein FG386_002362 [Cryptosporidium ryanae]|uniref:uncharacterized protein n=1 Tax=Cryptosporidium ryanae TaxID=515981 RepID=UPI003519FE80|nr:hypothetical protein FG386_002362 [Cryptosporidium ryanae]
MYEKSGDNGDSVFTFKDKNVLDYDENESDELDFNVNSKQGNSELEYFNDVKSEFSQRSISKSCEEKGTECKSNCFKRKNIKIIKKNQRVLNDNEKAENIERDFVLEDRVTNFNRNFLLNENGIFDDTDYFYDQLKINRKRKIQDIRTQFEKYESDSSHMGNYISDSVKPQTTDFSSNPNDVTGNNQNDTENRNVDYKLFLSLETEFCRNISSSKIPHIDKSNRKNVPTDQNSIDNDNKCNKNNNDLNNATKSKDVADNIEACALNETDILDSQMLNGNHGIQTVKNTEHDNILHQKPLDFGLSSTLDFLRKRGDISKNDTVITQDDDSNYNSFESVSIFHTDENGNILDQKSAFKRLCWKFHGQKVNKNKLERIFRSHIRNS